ncbi:SUF system NifU family Fe-S cluster assembly protein [Galbitalea sp. SE-J8]|uniref:Fe-S cluster assembly sulfur transfer protein SufU n=1 Tax=Galbitalea sp. SE-J8 TaxID=3054952 RepID=UPI00259D2CDA|nr:SUF system NifU family Fe-S cluster assembly protein [Galbitalea sp. SE-J8]MDM4761753.1 SUF system NifU family Fe-S cluster assembly protein [Galbitalea sp. SE-J8]
MSDLQALYQELIIDHSKHPVGFGLAEGAAAESHQLNPTCGDEVTLQLHAHDGVIDRITWEGHGCAISQSSASLLAQLVREQPDLSVDDLTVRIDAFREVMRSRGTLEADEELLGDAAVLSPVSKYTARVKCAMLAWVAAEHALAQVR